MSVVGALAGAYAASKAVSGITSSGALHSIATGIGQGLQSAASYSGAAASRANAVSAAAQSAQGAFNQASADTANQIAADRIAEQYAFNAAQAASANQFTADMWQKSADWNEMMWEKSSQFNAEEAQKQRDWQTQMLNTQYQRAIKDMEKAGLNPILAATHGINTGSVGGSAASIGSPTIGGASGYAASGGLVNGISASEGNYTGQMEYMGGMLGLLSAAMSGISSAMGAMSKMGVTQNSDFVKFLGEVLEGDKSSLQKRWNNSKANNAIKDFKNNLANTINPNRWANGDYNPNDKPRLKR